MASGKKTSNTSKTAHVMNLLSKNRPTPTDGDPQASEPSVGEPKLDAPSLSVPPIMASLQPDIAVSEQIKTALENMLNKELGEPQCRVQLIPDEVPLTNDLRSDSVEDLNETTLAAASNETSDEPLMPQPSCEPEIEYVNVMQVLVDEKAKKYIDMFGLCSCPRCVADVKAIALNNLQPKYVVMGRCEISPRLSVYEKRYDAEITMQLLQACKIVMEHPRHKT